jgi:hypothetical protein
VPFSTYQSLTVLKGKTVDLLQCSAPPWEESGPLSFAFGSIWIWYIVSAACDSGSQSQSQQQSCIESVLKWKPIGVGAIGSPFTGGSGGSTFLSYRYTFVVPSVLSLRRRLFS